MTAHAEIVVDLLLVKESIINMLAQRAGIGQGDSYGDMAIGADARRGRQMPRFRVLCQVIAVAIGADDRDA